MKPKKILSCLLFGARGAVCLFILLMMCGVLLGSHFTVEAAGDWPAGPQIAGGNAIVMDVNSGTVLYEKNSHEQNYPASITKILTALLAVENSEMDEKVTFSYDSVHKTEGSSIWRDVDEVMTMEQCMYALMLNSANECAYAIAEHVGGTYENFIKMMNDRVKALGCEDTNFTNPHGLTEENHYTSCYDMALIAREAIQNNEFREITGTTRYDIPPTNKHPDEITYLTNHQKMLWEGEKYYYKYCIGGKTGYTEAAGNTLVTYAKKDGMTLVCVVMNEKTPGHYEDTIALLNFCFENFQSFPIVENLDVTGALSLPENDYLSNEAFADINKNDAIVLPAGVDFSEAQMEIVYDETNPDVAATLQYTYGERVVGSTDIAMTKAKVREYPFSEQNMEEKSEAENVIQIDVKKIVFVIVILLLLVAVGFGIYKFGDNIYLIRYKLCSWKKRNIGTDVVRRKRKRRRR